MTNTREQNQEEQRRQFQHETQTPASDKVQTQSETELRHHAPLQTALPNEASGYDWKRETGDIQSYQHNQTNGWLHIDPQGQFYDRQAQAISRDQALDNAHHPTSHSIGNNDSGQTLTKASAVTDNAISL